MNFNEYQEKAATTDLFQPSGNLGEVGFVEKVLGLAGEAGEVTDKVKKVLRDKEGVFSEEDKLGVAKELGDVLWYLANISRYLGIPLDEIAKMNLAKLEDRANRGKIHGAGDER